jgi:two-component system nitrogen regulation response regulator GlnG
MHRLKAPLIMKAGRRVKRKKRIWFSKWNSHQNIPFLSSILRLLLGLREAKDLPPEVQLTPAGASLVPSLLCAEAGPTGEAPLPLAAAWPAAVFSPLVASSLPATPSGAVGWECGLEAEALALLATGQTDVWDVLSRRFESKLIQTALLNTRGRRIEAAVKLGIGRNTITRKIQELGLE